MRRVLTTIALGMALGAGAEASAGLALHLDGVRLERLDSFQLVHVEARWVNTTGAPIDAYTNFGGVFDGLELVIEDRAGREVRRVHYTHHQSPCAEHRLVPLAAGVTRRSIGFPLETPLPRGVYRVRLEGELAGSPAHRGFSSRTRTLRAR